MPNPRQAPEETVTYQLPGTHIEPFVKTTRHYVARWALATVTVNRDVPSHQGGSLEKILKNPLYYGYFYWDGQLHQGIHEPLVSRELFEQVQVAFHRLHKPRKHKHSFAYAGLVNCGHCGCVLTPEQHIKQSGKRYVYYRCTGFKEKCLEPYVREEELVIKFADVVKAIHLDEETLT